jgi:hypothetical protein
MKTLIILLGGFLPQWIFADSLPIFSLQPTNQTAIPGYNITFNVLAAGATTYQWRFNGSDILSATNSALQITNVQTTNSGYYLVIAKNSTGWVPSQMAYLLLDYTYGGTVPNGAGKLTFSNTNNTYFMGPVGGSAGATGTPTNGSVYIVAGPQLDQMQPLGLTIPYRIIPTSFRFYNGYYNAPDQSVSTIAPGQIVYYSTIVNYTNNGLAYTLPSTVININAGTNGSLAPLANGLKFPGWPEWPEPVLEISPPTNQLRVIGETVNFTNDYFAYRDFGIPTIQWRKDGNNLLNATNFTYPSPNVYSGGEAVFTITNAHASDAGVYDCVIYGNNWEVSPKIYFNVQTTNGQGVFQNPYFSQKNFICSLLGAAGRNYTIQWSTNLLNWNNLVTLSNVSGTITFTNSLANRSAQFYRSMLMP